MGNALATEKFLAMPLNRQRDFPFTINARFCKSRETTLVLRDNFWSISGSGGGGDDDHFAVTDTRSGRTLFRVQSSLPSTATASSSTATAAISDDRTKWLLDVYKIPVAHIVQTRTYTTAYDVFVGRERDCRMTQIEVQYLPMHNNPCSAEIQNPDTGEKSRIGVHGLWRQRRVFIYLDRGMTGGRQSIAKVFRPDAQRVEFGHAAPYHVTVAAGVDIAFVVLVCAALDDALQ